MNTLTHIGTRVLAALAIAMSVATPAPAQTAAPAAATAPAAAAAPAMAASAAPAAAAPAPAAAVQANAVAPGSAGPTPLSTDAPAAAPTDFGYDAFGTGTAILDGPVDANYLLSPGDEIVVTIWGELNETMNLVVTPEGFIDLPDGGGRIMTNGVTVGELQPLVLRALSQIRGGYINVQDPSKSTAFVDVRLGKIRPVVVYVVGEVNAQGAYPLSAAVANVINLLNNAGGVRRSGSLREVRIKRTNGTIDTVDLYGFFLRGDIDPKLTRLTQGDYVIVPLKQRSVTIGGLVRRPMTYELKENEGLKELVALAGGFLPDAYLRNVQLVRTEANKGQNYIDLDLTNLLTDPKANVPLMDKDQVTIGKNVQVRTNSVTIGGEGIKRAGTYEWKPGMKLSDLIAKGEGLREYAFLDRADLIRTDDDFTKRLISFPLAGLYTKNPDGTFAFKDDAALNFPLREMDEVFVQSSWGLAGKDKSVTLLGHVKESGPTVLAKGMTLYDLVFMRGGFQDPDFTKTTFLEVGHLTRKVPGAVGQRIIPFHVGKLLANDPSANMPLEDADVVRIYSNEELQQARTVSIEGLVNKPGSYPMSEGLTVEDLIVLAGGLSSSAVRAEAVIARPLGEGSADGQSGMVPTSIVVPIDTTLSAMTAEGRTPLRAADKVSVRHKFGWEPLDVASISGEVKYPGNYPVPVGGARLSDLLRLAGGLRPEAFPQGAALIRPSSDISTDPGAASATQEITIDLVAALAKPGGPSDLELRDGDKLVIPAGSGLVQVTGAVQRPMAVQHALGSKLSDYINICGGYKDTADTARVVVVAPNNAAQVVGKGQDPVLLPGTVVNVPLVRESERMQIVEIKGSVAKPALVQYIEDAPLGYYIGVCGGFTPNADLDRVVVILPDGRMLSKEGSSGFNPKIPAGATIVVTTRSVAGAER
ncbi:MAG: hypothetical protein FGM37_04145 [Phycisphaerales bacterium]|nr:hypothetical protein [Phycisphaerales bacterium]